jgi:glutamate-ammonia-ligase adenylyltransferase
MERALWPPRLAGEGAPDVSAALRRRRLATALALGIGDLAGAFPLAKVTGDLRAGRCLARCGDGACDHHPRARCPACRFLALALGKHGACELNYSSDIDPILLFDPETLPRRPREEPGEAAQNYARQVVRLLSHMDGEGYVFRVDLRLRPASEVSPLAISIDAALSHYESSALAWERAAFIRARRLAMWRWASSSSPRSALRLAQKPRFRRHCRDRAPHPPHPCRAWQGLDRRPRLRPEARARRHSRGGVLRAGPPVDPRRAQSGAAAKGTRAALDALAAAGIIDRAMRRCWATYDRLRTIEHRLQMVSDLQTHALPRDMAAIDAVARLDGLPDGAALIEAARHHRDGGRAL